MAHFSEESEIVDQIDKVFAEHREIYTNQGERYLRLADRINPLFPVAIGMVGAGVILAMNNQGWVDNPVPYMSASIIIGGIVGRLRLAQKNIYLYKAEEDKISFRKIS